MANSVYEAALHYADKGVPTLPLHFIGVDGVCSCGGEAVNPKCKPGKHPFGKFVPNGVNGASLEADTIKLWFDDKPYNVGIATGLASGLFVLDRDDKDGGHETLAAWEAEHGPLPATLTQTTGNGKHYCFKMPVGGDIRNSQKKLAPGIDIRGSGGYIVAAPSKHFSGRYYSWDSENGFDREQIAEAPDWLRTKIFEASQKPSLEQKPANQGNLVGVAGFELPDQIADGEGRESFILRYAGHLRGKGLDQDTIIRTLLDYNQLHINPPLDEALVVDRACRYEMTPACSVRVVANVPAGETANSDDGWPEPREMKDSLPPVPLFQLKLLPKLIQAYVQDVAERMSCPVEFPAVGALVSLASAIGSQIQCKPYAKGTWMVPAGIWGLVVSPPSAIKSPPLNEMLRPLRSMDKKTADKYVLAMQQYEIDKAIYNNAIKAAIKSGNNAVGVDLPAEPQMTRYIVNDSTYEMLVAIAKANPQGFLVFRDEIAGWFHSINKENQKEARGLYLTGWSGTEGYATDRIGRGHVRADCVNISLLGTIQPNVLRQIVYDAIAGGVGDDGLVARFQLAVYPDPVREYVKVDRYPNLEAMLHYEELVEQLTKVDTQAIGASFTFDGQAYLAFDAEAQLIFDNWRQKLENRILNPASEEHPAMLSHLGKYRSLFPKLALVLHLASGQTGAIGRVAAKRALVWTQLLEAHARRMYYTATNRAMQSATVLANKIKAGSLRDGFTRSEVLTKEWAGLRTAEEVGIALTVLKDMSWLYIVEDRSTGGRPAERYYFNPKVKRAA